MNRPPIIGLALVLLLLHAGGCASQSSGPQVPSDLTNPKAATLTFLRAISAGDVHTAKSACIGTDEQKASVDALASLITGLRAYDQAITTHFGTEAAQIDAQLRQAVSDLWDVSIMHAENALVHENTQAGTATVEPAYGGVRLRARPPMYLRKEKDLWKVDLGATSQLDKRFDPAIAGQYLTAGKALHEAARNVNAGRYKTLLDAQRDADSAVP